MTRHNWWLAGFLLLQCGLIGARWATSGEDAHPADLGRLLPGLDVGAVTELVVETSGDDSATITLAKRDGVWRVQEAHDYRADADKVEQTLRDLSALEIARVVASSKAHHVDMKVDNKGFERRVTVRSKKGEHTLLIGDSGRGDSVYARRKGEDTIYAVRDYSAHRLSSRAQAWLDQVYFEIDPERLVSIEVEPGSGDPPGLHLQRLSRGDWRFSDTPEAPIDPGKLDPLLDQLKEIRLSEVAGRLAEQRLPEPALVLTVGLGEVPEAEDEHEEPSPHEAEATEALQAEAAQAEPPAVEAAGPEASEPTGPAPLPATEMQQLTLYPVDEDTYAMHRKGSEYVVHVGKWRVEELLSASAEHLTRPASQGAGE